MGHFNKNCWYNSKIYWQFFKLLGFSQNYLDKKKSWRCVDTKQIQVANCKFILNFHVIFVIFASFYNSFLALGKKKVSSDRISSNISGIVRVQSKKAKKQKQNLKNALTFEQIELNRKFCSFQKKPFAFPLLSEWKRIIICLSTIHMEFVIFAKTL